MDLCLQMRNLNETNANRRQVVRFTALLDHSGAIISTRSITAFSHLLGHLKR